MPGIFISYRREDTEPWAGRLTDSLRMNLRRTAIFRDIDSMAPGVTFDTYIVEVLNSCGALIALIGPNWLTASDKAGKRRLDDANDLVCREIATALQRDVRVIPALVQGARMPNAEALPGELRELSRRNAFELTDAHWADDCRKLAGVLGPLVQRRGVRAGMVVTLTLVVLVAVSAGGFGLYRSLQTSAPPRQPASSSFGFASTTIMFRNDRNQPVSVYWNNQGREILYSTLARGQVFSVSTYVDHQWVIRDQTTGEVVARAEGKNDAQTISIR